MCMTIQMHVCACESGAESRCAPSAARALASRPCPRLAYPTYLDHIRTRVRPVPRGADRLRPRARGCPPAPTGTPPTCSGTSPRCSCSGPRWSGTGRPRPTTPRSPRSPAERPESYAELLEAFDDYSHALVTELERADPEAEAWHWSRRQTGRHVLPPPGPRGADPPARRRADRRRAGHAARPGAGRRRRARAARRDVRRRAARVGHASSRPAQTRRRRADRHRRRPSGSSRARSSAPTPTRGKNYDGPHLLLVDDPGTPADATVTRHRGRPRRLAVEPDATTPASRSTRRPGGLRRVPGGGEPDLN